MKVPFKPHRTSDSGTKHTKCSKKSKGAKKPVEKSSKDLCLRDSDSAENSTELLVSEIEAEYPSLKKVPLELRKTETIEWKFLKKIDCQRLETVLEEGHVSSEERISKTCEQYLSDESDADVEDVEFTPPENESRFFSFAEGLDVVEEEKEEEVVRETKEPNTENEKGDFDRKEFKVDLVEFGSPRSKKSFPLMMPKEKMEILPIFSNNKFHCSRDAISIGECEDLLATEKNLTAIGVTENKKEIKFDRKEIYGSESVGVSTPSKPAPTTTFVSRFKAFTEKYVPQTPSPFINSLLVLAPFSEERKMLLNEEILDKFSAGKEKPLPRKPLTSAIKTTSRRVNFADEEGTNSLLASSGQNLS